MLPWAEPVIPLATAARNSGCNARRAGGRQRTCRRGARDDAAGGAAAQQAQGGDGAWWERGNRRKKVRIKEIQRLRWFARIINIGR